MALELNQFDQQLNLRQNQLTELMFDKIKQKTDIAFEKLL